MISYQEEALKTIYTATRNILHLDGLKGDLLYDDFEPQVILAECLKSFGHWMIAHATELLTPDNIQVEIFLKEERHNVQLLLYCKQNIEICRLYSLDSIAGMHHWKHGRKGSGIFWLQQAHDEVRLNRNAQKLFDFVGKSISDEYIFYKGGKNLVLKVQQKQKVIQMCCILTVGTKSIGKRSPHHFAACEEAGVLVVIRLQLIHPLNHPTTNIDACAKGNLGRFINHNCQPNCRTEKGGTLWFCNRIMEIFLVFASLV
ncbi:unnamed protein product [Lactuca saligna]|uniref:Nuclear pore complex protein Nup85 n=1 Tax=Lactuca saligna TaxID=75948 RepID=A0AA35USR1_LACSI|nr:unnamed protein product [Lactuca saligna]